MGAEPRSSCQLGTPTLFSFTSRRTACLRMLHCVLPLHTKINGGDSVHNCWDGLCYVTAQCV